MASSESGAVRGNSLAHSESAAARCSGVICGPDLVNCSSRVPMYSATDSPRARAWAASPASVSGFRLIVRVMLYLDSTISILEYSMVSNDGNIHYPLTSIFLVLVVTKFGPQDSSLLWRISVKLGAIAHQPVDAIAHQRKERGNGRHLHEEIWQEFGNVENCDLRSP